MVVYSEGSFRWNEVWNMSYTERELAVRIMNNYNQTKSGKSPTEYL